MPTCAECSDLFLDYVYGLLDDAEVQALQSHLAGCAACQEALAEAKAQQNLLSRAALKIRQVPVFSAPGEADELCATPLFSRFPPACAEQTGAGPAVAAPRRRRWVGRAVLAAAAVLVVALGSLYVSYRRSLAEHQTAVAEARKELEAVDARWMQLGDEFKKEKEGLGDRVQGQFLHVHLLGPATYQASADTPFRLTVQSPSGKAALAAVSVRLVAREPEHGVEQVVFHDDFECHGELRFLVPAKLPVTPSMKPRLVVEVRGGAAKEVIDQPLAVEPPSYLTHLYLNKTTFRNGEILFFRTVTLDRFALTPVDKAVNLTYALCAVVGQKLELKKQLDGRTQVGGIGGGEFTLTDDFAEGDYLLVASENVAPGQTASVRQAAQRLHILRDDQPRLIANRDVYKPGETIDLYYQGRRTQNTPAAPNQKATVTTSNKPEADGTRTATKAQQLPPIVTDNDGNARFKMTLPMDTPAGALQVELQIQNGAIKEQVSQTIRVVPPRLSGEFFPEGGDLVAGLPNRVYFRLHVPDGNLAGLSAVLEDSKQHEVVKLALDAEASKALRPQVLGSFSFTPKFGEVYRVQVTAGDKPVDRLPLPPVQARGITLTVPKGVLGGGEPLRVQVQATEPRQVLVLATCRGRTLDQKVVEVSNKTTDIDLESLPGAAGVLRVTVFEKVDDGWQPAAERLVYRKPGEFLKLSAKVEKGAPKATVGRLRVEARTEGDVLATAWLLAAVTEDNELRTAGPRQPSLPAFFQIASELREPDDLENADVFLTDAASAPQALELFLGTQGWRRFKDQPRGTLAKLAPGRKDSLRLDGETTVLTAGTHLKGVQERLHRVLQDRAEVLAREVERKNALLQLEYDHAVSALRLKASALAAYEQQPNVVLRYAVAGLLLVLLAGGTLQLLAALYWALRARRSPRMLLLGSFTSLLLAMLLFAGTPGLRTTTEEAGRPGELAEAMPKADQLAALRAGGGPEAAHVRGQVRDAKVHANVFALVPSKQLAADMRTEGMELALSSKKADGAKVQLDDRFRELLAAQSTPTTNTSFQQAPARFNYATRMNLANQSQFGGMAPPGPAQGKMEQPGGIGKGGGFGGAKTPAIADASKGTSGPGAKTGSAVMREYAPMSAATSMSGLQDLVFWHPLLLAVDGTAEATFPLPSSGTYYITVFGHTSGGRLGVFQSK